MTTLPTPATWPPAATLRSSRLVLEPLRPEHATEAFVIFDDARLHAYTGGRPATAEELDDRFTRQSVGRSPDGSQGWLNWMLRRHDTHRLVGTVQATLSHAEHTEHAEVRAELAWVVATHEQGHGYAREAAITVADWLRGQGVSSLLADVHPGHHASAGVARAVGLQPTPTVVDGEVRWAG
ncbi:GNAT family N-acetyltransferase [Cellulomonas chengniuliangii]|uniref:GNAT family N-acetyltransferase n=1 Tax=Cellulomonas chengniuliangii TaxID=2968084 RepID=A0ABY5KVJ0_9CELL|nr:GNAT family N-acetyltransferase [Cellulomonas chengniuliangii]MCC2308771.1 GNAT family N-acetyltransferase [Cellulomonas chengniuliangii]UUI74480.1 GNAT family N-acetyltransferase [Cellulomonas chengniuliangii]